MHTLFLGTCRDLHASTLGFWLRKGLLGFEGDWNQQLRQVSFMLKQDCRRAGTLCLEILLQSNLVFCSQPKLPYIRSVLITTMQSQSKDTGQF